MTLLDLALQPHRLRLLKPLPAQPDLPLLIFLPGMDGLGTLQTHQAIELADRLDVRCLAIPADDLSSWDQLVDQVLSLILSEQQRVHPRPVYLCGESFGACLALLLVARSPQLFQGLILVNSASAFRQVGWLQGLPTLTRSLPELLYPLSSHIALPWLAAVDRLTLRDRQRLLTAMQTVTQSTAAWRLSLLWHFPLTEADFRQFSIPTVLIASGRDRLLPSIPEARRLAQWIPQSAIHILPHSGHACLLETEVNLNALLQRTPILGIPQTTPSLLMS